MSLYELETMWRNMNPTSPKEPTDQEWEEGMSLLEDAVANMPDVRL